MAEQQHNGTESAMSRPRRSRWLSIPEVVGKLVERYPDLAQRPRKRQLEAARRMVRRAELRDATRFVKRVGRDLYVSLDGLSSLLPVEVARLDQLDASVADLHQRHRQIAKVVNRQSEKIADHDRRIQKVEGIQTATTKVVEGLAELQGLQSRV